MFLDCCQIAKALTEQCGHETFQISGFWADDGQTGRHRGASFSISGRYLRGIAQAFLFRSRVRFASDI
jgi:hypothetical protein